MKIIHGLENVPDDARSCAVAIGNFDGVHRGHARIIGRLRDQASDVNGPAVVLTFDPHPVRILRPDDCPLPLTWTARKAELLRALGVDFLIICATDEGLLNLRPADFFDDVIRAKIDARAVVEGVNFFFGRDRTGTIDVLRELAAKAGIQLSVIEPFVVANQTVSSSRIRRLIATGDVSAACRMLTEPYRIRGMVTHGVGRGAKIGFPTANLDAIDTLLPAHGVYAGRAWVSGRAWPAAVNIGPSPTFGLQRLKVETHLVDYAGDLYGQPLEVDFLARLRDIHCFASAAELKAQLTQDAEDVRQLAKV
jgi:riboflavin kinase/FMN adenylyltransferase